MTPRVPSEHCVRCRGQRKDADPLHAIRARSLVSPEGRLRSRWCRGWTCPGLQNAPTRLPAAFAL